MGDDKGAGRSGGMNIESKLVRELAELLTETGLSEIEIEDGNRKIRVARRLSEGGGGVGLTPAQITTLTGRFPAALEGPAGAPSTPAAAPAPAPPAVDPGAIKSPMVGTVYLSAEPGAPAYAAVGSSVKAGDTLVIIEAMKVMNPITSPRAGTVTAVLVDNAQPVEFDQPLVVVS